MRLWSGIRRALLRVAAGLVAAVVLLTALYAVVPPLITPLMVIRLVQGEGLDKDWVSFERISPNLVRAVIASEDAHFCDHLGFDWKSIQDAIESHRDGGRLRGASTITQQTAKNLFLWPGGGFLRKAIEAPLALLLELLLDKQRIMELYLNVIEFGPGIYGAEAASRHHFGKPASELTRREAALLAVVLPNPRKMSASKPSGYVSKRAGTIQARMNSAPPVEPGRRLCH